MAEMADILVSQFPGNLADILVNTYPAIMADNLLNFLLKWLTYCKPISCQNGRQSFSCLNLPEKVDGNPLFLT